MTGISILVLVFEVLSTLLDLSHSRARKGFLVGTTGGDRRHRSPICYEGFGFGADGPVHVHVRLTRLEAGRRRASRRRCGRIWKLCSERARSIRECCSNSSTVPSSSRVMTRDGSNQGQRGGAYRLSRNRKASVTSPVLMFYTDSVT